MRHGWTHASDALKSLEGTEGPEGVAVGDDAACEGRTDAGKADERLGGGEVKVD